MASQFQESRRLERIASQSRLGPELRRWFKYAVFGLLAISAVAGVTHLITGTPGDPTPVIGSIHIVSTPPGADVTFDGTLLADRTPLVIEGAPVETRHKIVVSLRGYRSYTEEITIPRTGSPVEVMARLTAQSGKIATDATH